MHSFSTSSSRAIPTKQQIELVRESPFMPVYWGKLQSGMQAEVEISEKLREKALSVWKEQAYMACDAAEQLLKLDVHKQIASRVLEPFMYTTQVITATEFDNFFALRIHEHAQPEIRAVAEAMRDALDASNPVLRKTRNVSACHLPFISHDERQSYNVLSLFKMSSARCARTSYHNHNKTQASLNSDLTLYKLLETAEHMSPMSHQGIPIELSGQFSHTDTSGYRWSANFKGFTQFRHANGVNFNTFN
jgi:hypothetical protein